MASAAVYAAVPGTNLPQGTSPVGVGPGGLRLAFLQFTFPNPYVSGGIVVTAATFGLVNLVAVVPAGVTIANGYQVAWDATNLKIKAFTTEGTEAGAIDLSAEKVLLLAYGF